MNNMSKLNAVASYRLYHHLDLVQRDIFPVNDKETYIKSVFDHIDQCGFVVNDKVKKIKGAPDKWDIDNFNKIRLLYDLEPYIYVES